MDASLINEKPVVNKKRLTISLYLNYLIHGFGLIILAQNMVSLGQAWSAPLKTVSFVISGVGIGRLISYLITGALSDILSRKLFVYIGMACYLVFAVGMVLTHSVPVAFVLAILAGIANSSLDAGTYTTLVEINNGNGRDTILIKAFMSMGEFILPLIVASLNANNFWFGWSFVIMAALIIMNFVNISHVTFPTIKKPSTSTKQKHAGRRQFSLRRTIATVLLLAYGYTSMALMIWFTQWITLFAQKSMGYSNLAAHSLTSMYSIGSITGVLVVFALLKHNTDELKLIISLNTAAIIALVVILFAGTNPIIANAASFVFGFSAASGIMQTALTVFMKLFPNHHGMVTGAFYFFGSIASTTVPLITGSLSTQSIRLAFSGDLIVAVVGLALMIALQVLTRNVNTSNNGSEEN